MRRSLAGLSIVLAFLSCSNLRAQGTLMTGAELSFVTARQSDGLLNFYTKANEQPHLLSFENKSFVSVKVAGKIYTNNDLPPSGTQWLGVGELVQHEDSLIVIWRQDGFTFTQIAYPSQTQNGMKICVRFFVRNTGTATINAGSQYLLDVSIAGRDGGQSLTPFSGPDERWHYFKPFVPTHVVLPEHRLPNAPSFDPGITAIATFIDELYPVIQPDKLLIGHWPMIERLPYLDSAFKPAQVQDEMDQCILAQWPDKSIDPKTTVEMGGFYYGAADHSYCYEESSALLLAPANMETSFPAATIHKIPAYIFNYTGSLAKNVTVTARSTGALRFPDGTRARDFIIGDLGIDSSKMISIPFVIDTSSGVLAAVVSLSVAPTTSDVGYCETVIYIRSPEQIDLSAPTAVTLTRQNAEDCNTRLDSVLIRDNGSGIASLAVSVSNYEYTRLTPAIYPRSEATLRFAVLDTMEDASAIITAKDVKDNITLDTISYCTTPDVLRPVITCAFGDADAKWVIDVSDARPWDRKLNNISVLNPINVSVTQQGEVKGAATHSLDIAILDRAKPASFCINAIDLAGNVNDSCFTSQSAGVDVQPEDLELRILSNPASEDISFHGRFSSPIVICDLLGNIIQVRWLTPNSFSVRELSSGSYFLIAGAQIIPFSVQH